MPRFVITIILFLGAVVLGLFYLGPEWQNYQALRKDNQDLEVASAELDNLSQNRDSLIKAVRGVSKDDLDRINQALPQGAQAATFLVLIESLTTRHNLGLKRVDLAGTQTDTQNSQPHPVGSPAPAPTGPFNELPVSIDVVGSYQSFKDFLGDLEKNIRIVDVQSVAFTSPEKTDVFNINVKLKTYYQ